MWLVIVIMALVALAAYAYLTDTLNGNNFWRRMTFYTSPAGTSNGSLPLSLGSNDQFIEDVLHGHEHRFCKFSDVKVFATTFNVNGRPPPERLGQWLQFDNNNMPDFIAIGLQEMDLALGTYVVENTIRQDEWLFKLKQNLPEIYKQVECVRLIGIFMVLYRNEKSKVKVADIYTNYLATGFLRFGNKGGVGISLVINDTLVCFINSHFAAGSNELAKRNQDFREISQMRFSNGRGIYDHHVIFWLGDLNYRLNTHLTYEEVVRECNNGGHKELFAFDQVKTIDQKKKNAIYEEILRESDKKANELLPQISLSTTEFNFGPVYYRQPAVLILTIHNTGKTATRFMFRPAHQSEIMPDNWLSITPKSSFIEVGAKIDITLQVAVDNDQAWKITDGSSSELMCILVLGLDQGRDYFVIVQAKYQKSCFGSSFISLLEKPNVLPQREDWLIDLSDTHALPDVPPDPRVPVQIFRLVNALRIRGLKNIKFDESASENLFYRIRDCLDQGQHRDLIQSPNDFAFTSSIYSALLQLLDSFKEPVIPENVSIANLNVQDAFTYFQFRASLPPPHLNMLDYLMEFFRDLMIENMEAQSQTPLLADLIFRKKDEASREKRLNFFLFSLSARHSLNGYVHR